MTTLKQPNSIPITDKDYRLEEEYVYEWETDGFRYRIIVPTGFIYDGASVPRIVWTVSGVLPDGLIRAAALVHDWIYEFDGAVPEGSHQFLDKDGQWKNVHGVWGRKETDKLFARIMREAGVSKFKRRAAYLAVRAFGGFYWD